MKILTSKLEGAALDWAVEEALGGEHTYRPRGYSEDWSQGGPIIEREGIGFHRNGKRTFSNEALRYEANVIRNQDDAPLLRVGYRGTGQTPLIAAMRCFVASKLGNEVDIPEELV